MRCSHVVDWRNGPKGSRTLGDEKTTTFEQLAARWLAEDLAIFFSYPLISWSLPETDVRRHTRLSMRREYPAFYAAASRYVAVPLSVAVLIFAISGYLTAKDPTALYPLCITAFGVSVAMARLAFAFKPQIREDDLNHKLLYAGEKFSLSAILTLQLLFITFCRAYLFENFPIKSYSWSIYTNATLCALWTLVASSAVWSWNYGYSAFHDELWANWHARIEETNKKNAATHPSTTGCAPPIQPTRLELSDPKK